MKKWKVEYSEYGGYDCMTSAWRIESENRHLTVDCGGFGQSACDRNSEKSKEAVNKAKAFARFVMHALNAYEERQKE